MLDLEKDPEDKFPGNAADIIALNNHILIEKRNKKTYMFPCNATQQLYVTEQNTLNKLT